MSGASPELGQITVEQNVKLDRLSRDPVLNGTDTAKIIKTFMNTNPSEERANAAILKLQTKIAKLKAEAKNKKESK